MSFLKSEHSSGACVRMLSQLEKICSRNDGPASLEHMEGKKPLDYRDSSVRGISPTKPVDLNTKAQEQLTPVSRSKGKTISEPHHRDSPARWIPPADLLDGFPRRSHT